VVAPVASLFILITSRRWNDEIPLAEIGKYLCASSGSLGWGRIIDSHLKQHVAASFEIFHRPKMHQVNQLAQLMAIGPTCRHRTVQIGR
jgi:hypothetical protein